MGMPTAGVAVAAATPVAALPVRGFPFGRGLGPGAEVFGAGVPGQEPFQCRPGQGFPAVAAAFVEVGGQVGQLFRPAIWAVAVTVQITAALRAVSPFWEPRAFFLVTTGPRIALSATLLSLFRHPDKDNYPDDAVMPMSGSSGGPAAGQGGALAA